MDNSLLTRVVSDLVNKKARSDSYGVSLISIPDFNYADFLTQLKPRKRAEVFFLGFSQDSEQSILAQKPDGVYCSFSIEDAEVSRNSGNEDVFRILIIKQVGIEKLSSLRWFPEITLEKVYTHSCDLVKKELPVTNSVIEALLQALRSKQVRSILSFERVLDYLQLLIQAEPDSLPETVRSSFYKLGLLSDSHIVDGLPSKEDFIHRIRRNHEIVERISSLEQAERQSITNYYARQTGSSEMFRLILRYYRTKNIELLGRMELDQIENCLKAAKEKPVKPRVQKKPVIQPTALAAQLVFDDNPQQLEDILISLGEEIDKRPNADKSERIEVDVNGISLQVKTEPATEKIAEVLTSDDDLGGIIHAEVQSPSEAISSLEKYDYESFPKAYLDTILEKLNRISSVMKEQGQEPERITERLNAFLAARNKLVPYRKRLQDAPMLQVMLRHQLFSEYLLAYEKLLVAINEDFPKVWAIAASNAKEIINTVISLDYIFIVGRKSMHALPTPLNPLYLWKYVELAREILVSKGVNSLDENALDEKDKAFIIRKADDIPDPLSVMLLPATISAHGAEFLPLSGRLGSLPVYSNVPQINQSESGIDTLKQAVIRYLCLYPHAGMMLRLAIIDPPSVEVIVSMLKALNNDREFNIEGIEVSIYRTKEVPASWVKIEDGSLNDGMLGRFMGKRSLSFSLRIADQTKSYSRILESIDNQQHLLVVFDPNEIRIETAQNSKQIHIHPLCVPKVYKYNPIDEEVEIRPASEGGIFTVYSSILEKLNEHPSTFSHTSTFFRTPLKRDTYDQFLKKADWLVILDQSLKCWDISLRAASEKLFYKENDYRSVGIYSSNCNKFVLGYDTLVKGLGNFIPQPNGLKNVIEAVREINDDGLLSIVSHTSNRIFDERHGKGSLGTAVAAIHYKSVKPGSLLVGLDTQLAQEWLSEREDGKLPDLIGLSFGEAGNAVIDLIEVKTYCDNPRAFEFPDDTHITGHAVKQVSVLEKLMREICGPTERITTVSRREILREQVFECLFQSSIKPSEKRSLTDKLNGLFAGEFQVTINKHITFVDFEQPDSSSAIYTAVGDYAGAQIELTTIGSNELQCILSNTQYQKKEELKTEQGNQASPENTEKNTTRFAEEAQKHSVESGTKAKDTDELEADQQRLEEKCLRLNKVLRDYGIQAIPVTTDLVQEAARFTRFKVQLRPGVSESTLKKHISDIERELEANGEILVEHLKGTKYLAVDVPFNEASKPINVLENLALLDDCKMRLPFVAGQKPDSSFDIVDLAGAPHMLIAGTTGSGKTIFLYSILVSLLYRFSKEELSFLIIDPKATDFIFFNDLPQLYGGKVVTDADEALEMLQRINEVDKEERTAALQSCRSRDIESYNEKNPQSKLKRLVVVIDEYADLIQAAESNGTRKEFEKNLQQLLQRVRNLGIHLIIATQRPSAQIVTGPLKANIPFRVSFRLPSHTDSQTILDMPGAENLLGKGDMLMVTETDTKRMQGLFITESELERFLKSQQG